MYCKKCNLEYSGDQKFCGVCGEKLSEIDETIKTTEANDQNKVDAQVEERVAINTGKKMSKEKRNIIAFLCFAAYLVITLVGNILGKEDYREFESSMLWNGTTYYGNYVFESYGIGEDRQSDWWVTFYGKHDLVSDLSTIAEEDVAAERIETCFYEEIFDVNEDTLDMHYIGCVEHDSAKWMYYKAELKNPQKIDIPEISSWDKNDEIYMLVHYRLGTNNYTGTNAINIRCYVMNLDGNDNNENADYKSTLETENVIVKDNDKVERTEIVSTDKIKIDVDGLYSYEIPKSWENKYKTTIDITSHTLSFYLEEDFWNSCGGLIGSIEVLPIDTEFPNDEDAPNYGIYWSAVDYLGIIETEKGTFHIISTVPREGGQCSPENEDLYYQMSEEFLSVVVPSITPLEGYEYEKNFRAN